MGICGQLACPYLVLGSVFFTFTFLLRRRVAGLPAMKLRLQVRPGHPALHPAVVIPSKSSHHYSLISIYLSIFQDRQWLTSQIVELAFLFFAFACQLYFKELRFACVKLNSFYNFTMFTLQSCLVGTSFLKLCFYFLFLSFKTIRSHQHQKPVLPSYQIISLLWMRSPFSSM